MIAQSLHGQKLAGCQKRATPSAEVFCAKFLAHVGFDVFVYVRALDIVQFAIGINIAKHLIAG